jgi:aspartyl-tRNA(Asn)/glutamyl-tRNA(Gln) amidotransferase subunit A
MPTYGRVSRYGLIAFASSLDRIGPFTTNVADSAAVLSAIAGHDPADSTSAPIPVSDYSSEARKPLAGLRVGVAEEYFGEGLDAGVKDKVEAGIRLLVSLGCTRVPIRMAHTEYAIATYYIVATAEASSNLARYDGVRYGLRVPGATLMDMYRKTREQGFGPEVKRRIMLGTYALSAGYYDAYYLRAQKVRALIARDFSEAFGKVDVIITPTTPTPAFKIGEKTADPLQMYLADIYTVTGSLAGIPGMSVPCGTVESGLPVGMQIFGSHFDEGKILRVAAAFEAAGGFAI